MGNAKSKSTAKAESLNSMMVSIVNRVVLSCAAMATQDQLVDFSGNTGTIDLTGATFKQGASVDMRCAINAANKSAIAQNIANALNQSAAASNAFGVGTARANTEAKVTTTVNNAITNMTEATVSANIRQRQKLNLSNNSGKIIMTGFTASQSAEIVAQGIVDAVNNTGITTEVANAITQDVETDNSVLGSLFGDWTTVAIIIILVIVCTLIGMGVWWFWPDDDDQNKVREIVVQHPRQTSGWWD